MKNKKLVSVVIGMALLANLGLVAMASAAETTSSAQLTGGAFTLTTPVSQNFPNIVPSVTATTVTQAYANNSVAFADTRGGALGFTMQVTANDFKDTSLNPYANSMNNTVLSIETDANDALTAVSSSDCTAGITRSQDTFSAFEDAVDLGADGALDDASTAKDLLVGTAVVRVMSCTFEPVLRLIVPAFEPAATYTTTLTYTVS